MKATPPSDETFGLIVEAAPNAIVLVNPRGEIALVNSQTEKLFGYPREELLGRSVEMLVPERFRATHPEQRQAFFRRPAARPMGAGRDLFGLRKDGSEFPVEIGLNPIHVADGSMYVLSAIVDITERKRAEHRFELAIESSPSGMIMVDPRGTIVLVNSQVERLFGYRRAELIGQPVEVLVPERFRGMHPSFRERFFHGPQARPMGAGRDLFGRRKDGTEFPVEIGLNPIDTEDGVFALSAIADITDRKQLEQELRMRVQQLATADQQKDEFLAMLGHELRNPLAPIRNAVQLLKIPGVDADTVRRARDMIDRQSQHLARLVDDLLDVSRIISGRIELHLERVDLAAIVARAVETAQPVIDARGHALEVTLSPEPLFVEGDVVRLSQVLANLLTNAAKYTRQPSPIRISTERVGPHAVIRVHDSGIGIAPQMQSRIFELFVQADSSLSRSEGGLGIGLTLVKRLVEMHHGSVTATSAGIGRGSEFTVTLPAAPEAVVGEQVHTRSQVIPRVTDALPQRRVLVVDDNVDAAESIAMILQLFGYAVECVHDGRSAIRTAESYDPDAVVLDIGLPDISGYEVARELRSREKFKRTPLVAVTGYGQESDRRRSRAAGIDCHLTKPVDPDELNQFLRIHTDAVTRTH